MSETRRVLACVFLLIIILPGAAGAPALADDGAQDQSVADDGGSLSAAQTDQPAANRTTTRIQMSANGSAVWTLRIRTRLETERQREEYRAFQERFRENRSRFLDSFRGNIRGVVGTARNATDREMRVTGFSATTSIQRVPRQWGTVTYRFRWTGFAADTERGLAVGDVFNGGFFIADGDSLVLVAPEAHRVVTVDPDADERDGGTVSWTGREDFRTERPRVVFKPDGATAADSSEADQANGSPGQSLPEPSTAAVAAAVVGGLAMVVFVGYRRVNGDEDPETAAPLVTDEDRVEQLLSEHDGRMRQQAIASELDWSKGKTSRVLSRMADDDRIEKLRLGRENVIELTAE